MSSTRVTKNQRIEVRATERQEAVLRRAASATDRTMTDFILASAVEHAERVLAERRWFTASDEEFEAFEAALDAPLTSTAKFERLFQRSSPFGKAFEVDE